jgi:hypothetical protein
MAAVSQNGTVFGLVQKQTPEICLAAVTKNGLMLGLVKEQTPEICLAALRQCATGIKSEACYPVDLGSLQAVRDATSRAENGALNASSAFVSVFKLIKIKNKTPELCMEAVEKCLDVFQLIDEQTDAISMIAVKKNGLLLSVVKEQTPEICLAAVQQNHLASKLVKVLTPAICMIMLEHETMLVIRIRVL